MNQNCQWSFRGTLRLMLAAMALLGSLIGCATMDTRYAGYKVINKEIQSGTERVPVRVTACVTPYGQILCERRYGALTECSMTCRTPPNRWIERPLGYGGYEDRPFKRYFVTLQSPAGSVERTEVTEQRYGSYAVGQVIARAGEAGAPPTAPIPMAPAANEPSVGSAQGSQTVSRVSSVPPASYETPGKLTMAEAQARLTELGYDPGPADGLYGARTARALRAFQKARNIPASGQLDEATMAALRK